MSARARIVVSALLFAACASDDSGLPQPTSSAGLSTTGDETTTGEELDTTTSSTENAVDASDTSGPPACLGEGCPCDQSDPCPAGLFCDASACKPIVCGDELIAGDEACDDGNNVDNDGCDADCTFTEIFIDASFANTCALIEGGVVRCWGDNAFGQAGYGNTEILGDDEHPYEVGDVQLPGPILQLQSGDRHVCGRLNDEVLCWGDGSDGALGYGNTDTLGDDEFPSRLPSVDVGFNVSFVTTGGTHTCVISTTGQVKCWGDEGFGELGYGGDPMGDIGNDETPSEVGNVMIGAAIVDLSGGIGQTCVITSTGAVKCWGLGVSGQLGYGNTDSIGDDETPAAVSALQFPVDAVQVSAGFDHTCALFEDGTVRCWGNSLDGQLGQGNTEALGDSVVATEGMPISLPFDDGVIAISAGDFHNCALSEGGKVACWGQNNVGQLGTGDTDAIGDDELVSDVPAIVFDQPVRQIDAGGSHTCAVLEDYRVYCWGENGLGQLGLAHTDTVGDDELPEDAGPVLVLAPTRD